MERLDFKPSLDIYVALVELLERARQYKAVLALYKVRVRVTRFRIIIGTVLPIF